MGTDVTTSIPRPGRLGDPQMSLRDDPRADPRMVAALATFGLDELAAPTPVDATTSSREELLGFAAAAEVQFEQLFAAVYAGAAPIAGVTSETVSIDGPDGDGIDLYIHRPEGATGPLPGVVHLHGGGMCLLEGSGPCYVRWRDALAAAGLVVVGVEFRNAAGTRGVHQFPGGLSDCVTATRWVLANREELGIGKVIVSGESGGGNLTLATIHAAARDGWVDELAGAYALCPFISNAWASPPADLPSLHENDAYFLGCDILAVLAEIYDPGGANADDPTCWPFAASDAQLAGLPPHVISVNELDPLRDEGLEYQRRLVRNGVSAVGRIVPGTCHAGDMIFGVAMPDVFAATIRDIKGFADSL